MSSFKQFQPDAGNNTVEIAVSSTGANGKLPAPSGQGGASLMITNNGTNAVYVAFGPTANPAVTLPATDGSTAGSLCVPAGAIIILTRPDTWLFHGEACRATQTANLIFTAGQGV